MDCRSFPCLPVNLPSSKPEPKPAVQNKWRDSNAGVIGMNVGIGLDWMWLRVCVFNLISLSLFCIFVLPLLLLLFVVYLYVM